MEAKDQSAPRRHSSASLALHAANTLRPNKHMTRFAFKFSPPCRTIPIADMIKVSVKQKQRFRKETNLFPDKNYLLSLKTEMLHDTQAGNKGSGEAERKG